MNKSSGSRPPARRTGRPRLPLECARRNRVVTMVTDEELQWLTDCSEAGSTSVSSLVHDIVKQFLTKKTTNTK